MTKNADNARSWVDGSVWCAPKGTAGPASLDAAIPAAFREVGWISDAGVSESHSMDAKDARAWQNGARIRRIKTTDDREFKFACLEETATVMGLARPGSQVSVGAAASAVQTITITGTPTGGTFSFSFGGVTIVGLARNVSTTDLQTALTGMPTIGAGNVTVTGTAGSSYVLTFGGTMANKPLPLGVVVGSLTGGSNPTIGIAETTRGTAGDVTSHVRPYLGQDQRVWVFDFLDGAYRKRQIISLGEVTGFGDISYTNDLIVYEFTVTPYLDSNGDYYVEYSNQAALIPS